jgi:hypothetical protein
MPQLAEEGMTMLSGTYSERVLSVNKIGQPPPGPRVFWTRRVLNRRNAAFQQTYADVPPPENPGKGALKQPEAQP